MLRAGWRRCRSFPEGRSSTRNGRPRLRTTTWPWTTSHERGRRCSSSLRFSARACSRRLLVVPCGGRTARSVSSSPLRFLRTCRWPPPVTCLSGPFASERVVPQLAGVAAWVAAFRPEVYRWLADREPDLLLTANLATATDEQRRMLGRELLRQLDGDEPPYDRRYFLLSWEGMAADIEPYLADDKPAWVRREAARLLGDSGCRDMDERLVEVVVDIASRHPAVYLGEDVRLATTMVFALDGCDDPDLMDRLAAVVDDSGAPWQLRSDVLAELWRRLPTDGLLGMVERMNLPSQDPEFGSAVATALSTATRRGQVDLQSLLDWLDTLDFRDSGGFSDDWQQVVEAAAILAARSDDLDDARWTTVARLARGWLQRTAQLFTWHDADVRALPLDQRRRLASAILRRYPDVYTAHHLGRESGLVLDDREWWLSQLTNENPAAGPRLDAPLQDVTPEATAAGQKQKKAAKGEKAAAHFDLQRLTSAVDAFDWPATTRELRLPVDRHRWAAGAPLTRAPGWLTLDAATKATVINVAASFLGNLPTEPVADLMDAAADAFTIVAIEDPSPYTGLDPDVLLAWLKAIRALAWHDEAVNALVQRLAEHDTTRSKICCSKGSPRTGHSGSRSICGGSAASTAPRSLTRSTRWPATRIPRHRSSRPP